MKSKVNTALGDASDSSLHEQPPRYTPAAN